MITNIKKKNTKYYKNILKNKINYIKDNVIIINGLNNDINHIFLKSLINIKINIILIINEKTNIKKYIKKIKKNNYPNIFIKKINPININIENYKSIINCIKKLFGKLHGIINFNETINYLSPIENYSLKEWYSIIQTNLNDIFMLIKCSISLMKKTNKGIIIFTTTFNKIENAYWGSYTCSNSSILSLKKIISNECYNYNIKIYNIKINNIQNIIRKKIYFESSKKNTKYIKERIIKHYLSKIL